MTVERVVAEDGHSVWHWTFNDVRELHRALEEYTSFLDGTLTRHYGVDRGEREPDPDVLTNAARRRSEIDRCMDILERECPFFWRLLDIHYRHGASLVPRGWTITASRLGLRRGTCPPLVRCVLACRNSEEEDHRFDLKACRAMTAQACNTNRDTFRTQLSLATKRLFRAHEVRQGRTS